MDKPLDYYHFHRVIHVCLCNDVLKIAKCIENSENSYRHFCFPQKNVKFYTLKNKQFYVNNMQKLDTKNANKKIVDIIIKAVENR